MSSILKALRRVEQDRPPGTAGAPRRAVRDDFVAEQGAPLLRRRPRRRVRVPRRAFAGIGAALLLAALVWWRLPERSEPAVAAADPAAAAPESAESGTPGGEAVGAGAAPVRPPAAAAARGEPGAPAGDAGGTPAADPIELSDPRMAAADPAPGAALPVEVAERLPPLGTTLDAPVSAPAPPAPVAPAPEPAPRARVDEPAPETPAAAPPAPPAPAGMPVAEARPAPPPEPAAPPPAVAERPAPAPPAPAAAERPAPAPAVAERPPPPPPTPAAVEQPAPAPRVARAEPPAAPAAPKPALPVVHVERTRWHPSAERRVAWVSVAGIPGARELHEGEAVGAFVVKEIRPSVVIFLHGADTVERRVGER